MGATAAPSPAIVGALKCQKDPYLQTLETEVVSCEEFAPPKPSQQSGKSKTKKSTDPTKGLENGDVATTKTYLIELADSVLFPEGGGQHTDHGHLTLLNDNNENSIPITSVQRHGLRCIHFSPTPLTPGTRVRQTVDFARRWDLMQQHTGQHLLSAIMDGMELPTLGWSMGQPGEMNYVELPRKPTDEEVQTIQQQCNEKIRENITITAETPEDKVSDSLPSDYDKEKGVVRFIKIGEMDYNACCGTHLQNSSHINVIILHHTQTIRGTNCRLFFTAGDRAIKMATESINGLRRIAVSLSSSSAPEDVAAGVQRLSDQVSEARKKEKKMLAEIARFEGERIKSYLQDHGSALTHRVTDGLDFINLVVFEIKDNVKERGVVVLCSGEVKTSGSIVVLGKPDLIESMATKIKEVVSTAKGGGKGEKWQGKVTEWQKGEIEALKAAVEAK
ncbi:ThrRS/AlaRS common domain-containing protein [Decorospora gaudefroyi]|uniref:ThrRS/AlaRS common domain-containing protein n=1 Tax=Decorospora gaudefroyi TaxID=184978 RepID=A0A6A5K2V2_9PLEO|nr:ThrRS/AlaRS common domain-containing protein [Decorospora gaudefroyi]